MTGPENIGELEFVNEPVEKEEEKVDLRTIRERRMAREKQWRKAQRDEIIKYTPELGENAE